MVDKKKFQGEEGYNISIIGRHVQVTEAMKNHARDKLSKIERFHNHIMHVHVTMDIQKLQHTVIVILKVDHTEIKVEASSNDMYASIDKAMERLQTKMRRWKSKLQDWHEKRPAVVDMMVNVLQKPYEEEVDQEVQQDSQTMEYREPHIIGNEMRPLKILTGDEAVMKMELSDDQFMLFRDEKDRKLKVIFRRDDGNYGIMQPE